MLLETLVSITAMLISVGIMLWNERVLSYNRRPPNWIRKLVDDEDKKATCNGDPAKRPLLQSSNKAAEVELNIGSTTRPVLSYDAKSKPLNKSTTSNMQPISQELHISSKRFI